MNPVNISRAALFTAILVVAATLTASAQPACAPAPAGLLGWWRGERNASDSVGTNNGTLIKGVTYVPGEVGEAFNFTNIDSAVDLGNPVNLQIQDFSLEVWFKRASSTRSSWDSFGIAHLLGASWGGYGIGMNDAGHIFLSKIGFSNVYSTNSVTDTNAFHHVVVTKSGPNVMFYVDGVAENAPAYDPGFVFNGPFAIGARGSDYNSTFMGAIDEASIYNRALTSVEVTGLYQAGSAGKCVVPAPTCTPPPSGLVAWWKGDGNANDTVGGYNGVLANGTGFTNAEVAGSFIFNGTNQCVEIPDAPALDPTNALSLEGWIYVSGNPNTDLATIVTKFSPTVAQQNQYQLETHYANGRLNFRALLYLPSGYAIADGATTIQFNTWYHVAMTYDGAALKIYVNGGLDGSVAASGSIAPTAQPLRIGGPGSGPWWFKGRVDELSLYSRALTSNEVQAVYSAGTAGKCMSPATVCTPAASGIVSLWRGEGNGYDSAGTNTALLLNGIGFAAGEVGKAFSFDGASTALRVPASPSMDVGGGNGLSIEGWIDPINANLEQDIAEWNNGQGFIGTHFSISVPYVGGGPGSLWVNLVDTNGGSHQLSSTTNLLASGVYQHVAVTYNKMTGLATLYLNGAIVAQTNLGSFVPYTSSDFYVGWRPSGAFAGLFFGGTIDELALYNRELSNAEVLAIYKAGGSGKCAIPPGFVVQPASVNADPGANVSFTVVATGDQPLSYQWLSNGFPIGGATNPVLSLSNLQPVASGIYSVIVSNTAGSETSVGAILTLNATGPCAPAPSGLVSWWRGEGNAVDSIGANDAVFTGASFGVGEVGEGFNFDGSTSMITVPASPSLNVATLTIEAWIFPTDATTPRPIFEYANATGLSALNFWYNIGQGAQPVPGALFGFARDASNLNNNFYVSSPGGLVPTNQWTHVAFVFDSTAQTATLYVNGTSVASVNFPAPVHPNTGLAVNIGYRPTGSGDLYAGFRHKGKLDEVSLYSRALGATEVQAIFNAGAAGKCVNSPLNCTPPPSGLLAWWKGDGSATDVIGGNNGVLKNGTGFTNGEVSGAFIFNGVNQYVEIPDSPALDPSNALTLEGWVYVSGNPNTDVATIVTKFSPTDPNQNQYQLETHYAGGKLNFRSLLFLPSGYAIADGATTVQFNTWYHLAMTYDGAALKLYVNGSLDGSVAASGSVAPTAQPLRIGGPSSGPWWFNGRVDELSLYSRALGSNEVQAIFSAGAAGKCVNPPATCTPPPSGLLAWWKGDGSATDVVGGNNGVLKNGTGFTNGEVSSAFIFNGVNQYVEIPDSPILNPVNRLTLEGWVYVSGNPNTDLATIVTKFSPTDPNQNQYQLETHYAGGRLNFRSLLFLPSGYAIADGATTIQFNTWYHVAMTYDGAALKLYVNGSLDGSVAASGSIAPTAQPLRIGGPSNGPWWFNGRVDELSLYDRALSGSEVQAIYASGSSGKCLAVIAPTLELQPQSQSVVSGSAASLYVAAGGSLPLSYQWFFNGSAIPGATSNSLAIPNVTKANVGSYFVIVTNVGGAVTSSVAALTLTQSPSLVQVGSTSVANDGTVSVPVLLVASGSENALAFSLDFDPTLLSYGAAIPGSGASSSSLIINSNGAAMGQLGVAIALPAGTTFAAGTQQVLVVSFGSPIVTNPTITPISFGDSPIQRQLATASGATLPANFASGTVVLPTTPLEGDVYPRPGGDDALTISDWVLVGRYVAGLDSPTNALEFQRADCAPRSTLGDGALTVSDWVQAGRYAAALDPLTRAGGPAAPIPMVVTSLTSSPVNRRTQSTSRQVRVTAPPLNKGQTGTVQVSLEAVGDENALAFSLSFDPSKVIFSGVAKASGAAATTLNVNSNSAAAGRLGFVLALNANASFAAGTQELLQLKFTPISTAPVTAAISFSDQPVTRGVCNVTAEPLAADYINSNLILNGAPALMITHSSNSITLSWPTSASGYILQQTTDSSLSPNSWKTLASPTTTSNSNSAVTVPTGANPMFYRLYHP